MGWQRRQWGKVGVERQGKARKPRKARVRRPRAAPSFVVQDQTGESAGEDDEASPEGDSSRIEEAQLTQEQRLAAQRALDGESLFMTGAAGTGKSFLLRYLVQELEQKYPGQVAVTASTGIAAANIGGQTIHSFAGIGLGVGGVRKLVGQVKKNSVASQRWINTRVLVLDEISMLDGDLFSALDAIASSVRGKKTSFGGLQLLLCGDFLQLPPVQGRGESQRKFCFQSESWKKGGLDRGSVVLCESVRQAGDTVFSEILNEVRVGIVSSRAEALLSGCHASVKAAPQDQIIPTKLYCLNKNVDAENASRLAKLHGETVVLTAKDHFKGVRDAARRKLLLGLLEKKVPAELKLKVGAQVILIKNQPSLGLVNGSRGRVESFQEGRPVVRFDTGRRFCLGLERFSHGSSSASVIRLQVPLKLGWALTVHKAQGMTLSRAELQVDEAFEAGQTYVALSRLTGTAGLWIRGAGLSTRNTRAHPEVLRYYEAVQSQSRRPGASTSLPAASSSSRDLSNSAALTKKERAHPGLIQQLPGPQRKRALPVTAVLAVPDIRSPSNSPEKRRNVSLPGEASQASWVTPPRNWCETIELD